MGNLFAPVTKYLPIDKIVVNIPTSAPLNKVIPEEIQLNIIYEDEF